MGTIILFFWNEALLIHFSIRYNINEPPHETSNKLKVVYATSNASEQPAHTRSLIRAFANRLSVKLLTDQLSFLRLKGGCTDSSESIRVKMPRCWKSHVTAQMC